MATFKLKNGLKESGFVPGVGQYVDGVLENAPETFENPNFELVVTEAPAQQPVAQPVAQPTVAPVAPAAPVASPQPQAPVQTVNQTPTQEGVN